MGESLPGTDEVESFKKLQAVGDERCWGLGFRVLGFRFPFLSWRISIFTAFQSTARSGLAEGALEWLAIGRK